MAKIRVHELAKELGMESKDVVRRLTEAGLDVKGPMSTLESDKADFLRQERGRNNQQSFVPKVTRIPRAAVEASKAEEGEAAAQPVTPSPADVAEKTTSSPPQTEVKKVTDETVKPAMPVVAPQRPVTASQEPEQASPKATESVKQEPTSATVNQPSQSERPQDGSQNRVPSERSQGNYQNRGQNERSQGNSQNRFQGERPQGNYQNRPQGSTQNRPQGERPQGNHQNRPQGNRPQGGYQGRPQGDRSQGGYQGRSQGDRPQGGNYQGNRPQGGYQGRPQGNNYQGNRPQGGRPQNSARPAASKESASPILEKPTSRRNDGKKKDFDSWSQKGSARIEEREIIAKNRNNRNKSKNKRREEKVVMPPVTPKKVIIGETVVLSELAKNMGKTATELIKKLFEMGTMATINQELDADTAILLADEFHVPVEVRQDRSVEIMEDEEDDAKDLMERPPVVTVMGHVDHGKTSLLDAIRKTNVISTEAGGITQHIGAYQVEINNHRITFLDTPGHAAFTSMRARGAQMTDIAILVVAADDGVMPQTVEAINHSKAAGVPIIVAINKIDRPNANPDRVKQELTEHGLVSEEWGGDTIMVPISAKKGENIQTLLEMILLVAEVGELKANPKRQARGVVIEAQLDKGRGPVATLLVQKGTLHVGDNIISGGAFGKIRAMLDDKGRKVKTAGPSTPVEVLGFSEVPPPGEVFMVVKDEKDARYVAEALGQKQREQELRKSSRVSLDDLFAQISQGEVKDLNVVLKADVQGSVEAVRQSLEKLSTDEVHVNIIHAGVGAVNESDVMLATASNAIIIGFNVRPDAQTRKAAEKAEVDMRLYRVIYDAIDDVKKAMSGLLAPEFKENLLGHAEVRSVFRVPKAGMIAGCYVQDGKISRGAQVRIVRDGIVIFEGEIASLRRFKDDVKEVVSGYECGIGVEDYNDIREGDTIEAFIMEEVQREI